MSESKQKITAKNSKITAKIFWSFESKSGFILLSFNNLFNYVFISGY
jgi:hypothetical protein